MKVGSGIRGAVLGTGVGQSAIILNSLSLIITTPIVLSGLGAEAYGINIIAQQLVFYLSQLDFGFGGALTRRLAAAPSDESNVSTINRLVSSSCLVFGAMGLCLLGVGFLSLPWIPDWFAVSSEFRVQMRDLIAVSLVLLGVQLLYRPLGILFFARQKQALFHLLNAIPGVLMPWLTAVFVIQGFELYSFVLANVCASALALVLTVCLVRKHFPDLRVSFRGVDWEAVRDLFGYGKHLFVITICGLIVLQSDRLITGAVLSIAAVTAFSLSLRIPELVARLTDQIVVNLSPYLIELTQRTESKELLRQHYQDVAKVVFFVVVSVNCAIAVVVESFISAWIGNEYFFGNHALYVALFFKGLFSISLLNSSILNAQGRVQRMAWVACLEAVLHVVFAVWWGHLMGVLGILLGGLVAHAITASILNSLQVAALSGSKLRDLYAWPAIPPLVGFVLAALFVEKLKWLGFGEIGSWAGFFSNVGLTVIVFGLISFALLAHPYYAPVRAYLKKAVVLRAG